MPNVHAYAAAGGCVYAPTAKARGRPAASSAQRLSRHGMMAIAQLVGGQRRAEARLVLPDHREGVIVTT